MRPTNAYGMDGQYRVITGRGFLGGEDGLQVVGFDHILAKTWPTETEAEEHYRRLIPEYCGV